MKVRLHMKVTDREKEMLSWLQVFLVMYILSKLSSKIL